LPVGHSRRGVSSGGEGGGGRCRGEMKIYFPGGSGSSGVGFKTTGWVRGGGREQRFRVFAKGKKKKERGRHDEWGEKGRRNRLIGWSKENLNKTKGEERGVKLEEKKRSKAGLANMRSTEQGANQQATRRGGGKNMPST